MDERYLEELIEELIGKNCRIETTDGSIRTEKVAGFQCQDMEMAGQKTKYPIVLHFDERGLDGVEMRIVKSVTPIE